MIPPDYASSLNVVYFPQLGKRLLLSCRHRWCSHFVQASSYVYLCVKNGRRKQESKCWMDGAFKYDIFIALLMLSTF